MTTRNAIIASILASLLGVGCGNESSEAGPPITPGTPPNGTLPPKPGNPSDPGKPVAVEASSARKSEAATIQTALSQVAATTDTELAERRRVAFQPAPTYDLSSVAGLSLIQASTLAFDEADLAQLGSTGFAISSSRSVPSFLYGYANIYAADLPVYISADSILYSIHDSYEAILKELELGVLVPELDALLGGMRERLAALPAGVASATARADADLYLTLAASLLQGKELAPNAGGNAALVSALFAKASAAEGEETVKLFEVERRNEDFSQFEPRGHYAGNPVLERYFRAMIWLGRIDFRMLETQQDGSQVFRRRQLEAALLLRELIDAPLRARFDRIDATVTAFVGEHDYMRLGELDALLSDLEVNSLAGLAGVQDETIVQVIADKGYGAQRISSHIMINDMDEPGTLPLSASFALLGQRYVIDSHVFSNVVFDRAGKGAIKRMMPNPLDVAYAALENDQAVSLLAPELARYAYAADLESMRVLADAHPPSFWGGNLYNLWLSALRTLSPDSGELADPESGLFPAARSEVWGRRLLSTQLASWAELRHDTILYAKQSYTGGISCEFPDAYVDPYPEFYAKVAEYAARGKEQVTSLNLPASSTPAAIGTYFDTLETVAARLEEMARYQRTGAAFTAEMMEFINDAVTVESVCGGGFLTNHGWYGKLFFEPNGALEFDPTIADVHTQPTDEGGNMVGRVLHVGTGAPRPMAVIAEGCNGPRAYVGLVSSYYEQTTEDFDRLTDQEWKESVAGKPPAAPDWFQAIRADR
jgi:hypothetical protein